MSLPSSILPEGDEVDLSVEFQGLTITVRGPAQRSADFIHRLSRIQSDRGEPNVSQHHGNSQSASFASASSETRPSIEQTFCECPDQLLGLASRLLATNLWSPRGRIRRAWRAGQWAGATNRGRVSSPKATPAIDIPNKVYVVIASPRHTAPAAYRSSSAFFAAIGGTVEGSEAICHGFPSEAEARAYCAGAGEHWPGSPSAQ